MFLIVEMFNNILILNIFIFLNEKEKMLVLPLVGHCSYKWKNIWD